jgi:hypothetical protein
MEILIAMLDAGATIAMVVLALMATCLGYRVIHGLRVYFKFRGARLVTCPETRQTAVVEVGARSMGLQAILDEPCLHLSECSRWPTRGGGCAQDCLRQIEASSPEFRFSSVCRGT